MSIQVTCSCGARLQAPPETAGRRVRCPKCGSSVAVPVRSSPTIGPKTPPRSLAAPAASPPVVSRPGHGKWLLIGGALGGLAAVAVLGVLIALIALRFRSSQPRIETASVEQPAADDSSDTENVPEADDKSILASKETVGDTPRSGKKMRADDARPQGKKVLADNHPSNQEPENTAPLPNEPEPRPNAPSQATAKLPSPSPPQATAKLPKAPVEVTFLNTTAQGQRFCIIADNSGSMIASMNFLKRELAKTLGDFKPESQFYVTFFNDRADPMPGGGWLQGTPENANKVNAWIRGKSALGGTQPLGAFEAAFKLDPKPDTIFFMTDGLIPFDVPDAVAALNKGKPRVTIHTIMFKSDQPVSLLLMPPISDRDLKIAESLLRKIADDSGGNYRLFTPCTPEELARAAETGNENRLADAITYIPRMGPEVRKVIPRLLAALPKAREKIRSLIIEALGKMGPLERAHVPALLVLLKESAETLQLFALTALASLGNQAKEAVSPLRDQFLGSEKEVVLLAILKTLGQVAGTDRSLVLLYRDHGLKKSSQAVRLASFAALRVFGRDALPFRLLAQLSFEDANESMRRAAQAALRQRMKEVGEDDLGDVRTLLGMKKHNEAIALGLVGVTRLGPKAKDCLPDVLTAFTGEDDPLSKASVPALRALGEAAQEAVNPLMERLPKAPPNRQMDSALVLAAIAPEDPKVVPAIAPLLVGNLHPKTLDKEGPPEMLLASIKAIGTPIVPHIFEALSKANKRGAVAANHRKYLFFALERLGPVAYSKDNLRKVSTYTSAKVELYDDVRTAAGKARRAMTP